MTTSVPEKLSVTVDKPIPLEFDMAHLCCFDNNPLPPDQYSSDLEACLSAAVRDGAQALINQVLTTLPLKSTSDGIYAELPEPVTSLPREKPVPKEREPTKWELFAKKKGIKAKQRDGKLVYDEETGEWVPKWGYKGKNKDVENQWLVEVDEKREAQGKEGDERTLSREERKRRIKLNERQHKKNERRDAAAGKLKR
ncbi:ribosomal biogenesis regulatory protein [Ascodesmis nigricans]|uniref:Ribosome biogenesis regulatory protein n=1 Tax=Ascodesmis nigricans TaxID=341454 RepID=A0A4S2N2M5_9PEZI|nr:ribosomal biogenesis regulatory protein [Ascodesmis nigricans]